LVVKLLRNLDRIIGGVRIAEAGQKCRSLDLTGRQSFKEHMNAMQVPATANSPSIFPDVCLETL
jgi:hypothetical protein